jgi:alkylhydroperoxidase/carboxymuconolactone decarboxylase family protein YurZ
MTGDGRKDERPAAFVQFINRFPKLGNAWDVMREAETEAGPMDEKTRRLVKLAIAAATQAEGATHSAARKARGAGVSLEEMEQVVALAASTIGLPNAVKIYRWIRETGEPRG